MKARLLMAVLAVAATPIAVAGQEAARKAPDASQRRVCTTVTKTGSRLGAQTRCRTVAEWQIEKAEARGVVDRLQAFKPTICSPPGNC